MSLNLNTVNRFFCFFRKRIVETCSAESVLDEGEIELDESYFGAKRIRDKQGCDANGKVPVFGMLKRLGKSIHSNSKKLFCK